MPTLGVKIPVLGGQPVEPGLNAMATEAEAAGAQGLWISDHIVITEETRSPYPFSSDGKVVWQPDTECIESMSACAWLAARTSHASVGTAVLVLPQRDPVLVAKTAATIDWLSGGRFVLGVGAGWYAEEFNALGWDFATRGRRMNEAIEVLRACWTGRPSEFEGEFFRIPAGVLCFPTPVRPDGIPLLIGGMTNAALDRVAKLGDGWVALTRWDDLDVTSLARKLEHVHASRPSGRARLRTVLRIVGTVEVDDLRATREASAPLAKLGFDEIAIDPPWHDLGDARQVIAELAAAIS